MSKSKGNVVDPDDMIEKYGSDTMRLFILFASPPEKDLEWNDQGVEGCFRFIGRVWRLVSNWQAAGAGKGVADVDPDTARWINKTIKKVADDIERFHFNTAVASVMELVNYLYTVEPSNISKSVIENLILIMTPFAPHMAEELWQSLGNKGNAVVAPWPKYDSAALKEDVVTVVVQVNGKLRDKMDIAVGASDDDVKKMAKELDKVKQFVEGKSIKKEIYIPGKLVNIVVA